MENSSEAVPDLVYSSFVGGADEDVATGIALDGSGNAYLTGLSRSADFPTVNPLQGFSGGTCEINGFFDGPCSDAIVTQINTSGSMLIFSTYLGGAGADDSGAGIAVDAAGDIYVAGTAGGTFPFTQGALQISGVGFTAKISPANAPALSFDTQQVNFGSQGVGTTSGAVNVLLRNSGSATLNISSISTSGDFAQTNNCGSSVAAGSNCTVQLTFAPTTLGPHNGMLTVNDDAAGSPHSIPLSGTGTQQVATTTALTSSLTPSNQGQSVTFKAMITPAGATGQVSLRDGNTVIGSATLNASGVATFSTSSLSGGSHSITAVYPGDGNFTASTSAALTQVVNSISLMSAQTSATVSGGGTATFPLTVSQAGALTSAIAFSCSGMPAGWNCGFNPVSVPAGSGPTQVTLTLQVGSTTAYNLPRTPIPSPGLPASIWLGALALLVLPIHFGVRRRKVVSLRPAFALGLVAVLLLGVGCGSGGSTAPPPQTVNVKVNATSGSTTTSIPLTITVR